MENPHNSKTQNCFPAQDVTIRYAPLQFDATSKQPDVVTVIATIW